MRCGKLRRFLEGYKDNFVMILIGAVKCDTDGSTVHWERGAGM